MTAIVFTDLDGTLLDHTTYDWAAAEPALAELRRRGVPLVLASSKTAAEVAPLHATLDLGSTPSIVENGAGIFTPGAATHLEDADYHRIRAALAQIPPDLARHFRGFHDMNAQEVAAETGLPPETAGLARIRCFSEPGIWQGSDTDLRRFRSLLAQSGISARQGGRFLTLSFGRTKADAMREVAAGLGATVTIALGDAPNDAEMLERADFGVIVRNDHAPPMPPLSSNAIRRTEAAGPEGWNSAVLALLNEIDSM